MKIDATNGTRLELAGATLKLRKPDGERVHIQLPREDAERLELLLQAVAANNPEKLN